MTLADRLRKAMNEYPKMTGVALAAACNVKPPSVSAWLSGDTKSIEAGNLLAAATALNVRAEWLQYGKEPMRQTSVKVSEPSSNYQIKEVGKPALKPAKSDLILIPQYDTGGAMGHGLVLNGFAGVIHSMEVSREWVSVNLRQATKPENLCVVTGFGDSMRGMYNPGDPLIVDTGVKVVDFDGVYFFRVGNEGFIKRLQRVPGQGLIAISENKAYQNWTVQPDMDFEVFGRVLKAWKSEDF